MALGNAATRADWQATTREGRRATKRAALLALISEAGKRCTSCHWRKPAPAFAVCEARGDGLQLECRDCGKLRSVMLAGAGGRPQWHAVRDALRAQAEAQTFTPGGN